MAIPNPNQVNGLVDQPQNRGLVGVQRPDSVAGLRGLEPADRWCPTTKKDQHEAGLHGWAERTRTRKRRIAALTIAWRSAGTHRQAGQLTAHENPVRPQRVVKMTFASSNPLSPATESGLVLVFFVVGCQRNDRERAVGGEDTVSAAQCTPEAETSGWVDSGSIHTPHLTSNCFSRIQSQVQSM